MDAVFTVSEETFTVFGDVGEPLVLTPFPLAVADVEVDVDGRGEAMRSVRRDFHQQRILRHRQ